MDTKIQEILDKMRVLEYELIAELQKKEKEFFYEVTEKKIKFQQEIKARHRLLVLGIGRFLRESDFLVIISAPIIYFCFVPAVFLDLVMEIYQAVCFPIYRIPKVVRSDYIVLDHHYLRYLNTIEKINCAYCSYFNGLIGYVREIAARTEQYWCPIKHARKIRSIHSRYKHFLDFGDAEGYRKELEEVRRSFDDLQEIKKPKL